MRIGKLFVGWRPIPEWERLDLGLPWNAQRGFFIQWGDPRNGAGLLLMINIERRGA